MSQYTITDEIVSENNLNTGVSYCVALAVGKKVCSVANVRRISCHHTTPIPALHTLAEVFPTRAHPTGCYSPCVAKPWIYWKHLALLLVGGMVEQIDGYRRELRVVIYGGGIG